MLLRPASRVEERKAAARGPLAPLFQSLAAELEPAINRDLYIPRQKALLSRAGGRCERDASTLEFDPFSPHAHRCPGCGTSYSGEAHDRAWITWYHLWLAERAVHASLFHVLTGEERYATFARDVLRGYADAYLNYPNVDNVLGPTRPFFSTYLESIWLLQVCVAADQLQHAGDRATAEVVREKIVEPSSALIAGFDEGSSNRQVWNNAAMLASALLMKDTRRCDEIIHARSGVSAHLANALLSDGTWFEGDNYHQFAIRGLWYSVVMCEANGVSLSAQHTDAFNRGVAATFASALPDFTFPSRKDSQYAVSLRQWRFAELAELGFARTRDEHLGGALARCYETGHERHDTGRSRSTADSERNSRSSALSRADLGWRALLHALPELPPVVAAEPRSVHLTGQGLAIFRRPGAIFAAMDYGQSGAGHGHPDRLNLLLSQGNTRWLDDLGTGSYVEKTLHWYRSSLAHNAPFVDGRSQRGADGQLLAYEERGDIGWVEAQFVDGEVSLTRTLIVAPKYMAEELAWSASEQRQVDVPWHLAAQTDGVEMRPVSVDGGQGLEDGFDFARDWHGATMNPGDTVRFRTTPHFRMWLQSSTPAVLLRAEAPGQPASKMSPFYMVRLRGSRGRVRSVLAWEPNVDCTFQGDGLRVELAGERHTHCRTASGWRVESLHDGRTTKTDLGGRTQASPPKPPKPQPVARTRVVQPVIHGAWWSDLASADRTHRYVVELGEHNYRRSEVSWREAGSPSATIAVSASHEALELLIDVRASGQRFAPASAINALDNEHADTMGAGVQVYVDRPIGRGMWMFVPEGDGQGVRVRPISGSTIEVSPVARWRPTSLGYEMLITIPRSLNHVDLLKIDSQNLDLTLVINDAVEGRERRRGQLVTGDARGEFVYLRGDREDGSHALHLTSPV